MENEKMQINLASGQEKAEIIIRETNVVNELPIKAPIKLDITGTIGAVAQFLYKRNKEIEQITQERCMVLVDREKMTLTLITNEHDEYLRGKVTGKLMTHPKFIEFGINTGKTWEPNELGQFMKMNRAFFADKTENMSLVTQLKNFEAKINSNVEKQKSENGSFSDNYSAVVTSNLPGTFKLNIPIFKGNPAEMLEVEFYAAINGRTVLLQLFSPGACQALEDLRDSVIDAEIEEIQSMTPGIAIIEQ